MTQVHDDNYGKNVKRGQQHVGECNLKRGEWWEKDGIYVYSCFNKWSDWTASSKS